MITTIRLIFKVAGSIVSRSDSMSDGTSNRIRGSWIGDALTSSAQIRHSCSFDARFNVC
ncbi:expressed protein [Batrachochytrium dendrobatidis JAM81]|uniref:Expressed protein n=1 Tax=Batrachochytrium dendrobatidis (strain JAM81 / FGSC 10211) TaxID=684364 RepID=F4P0G6_BATDJ|nr:uncharacterized protein BATDEDRAFT_36851 [Batrachochytrium dendrobatidis JAM81]EGF81586.1 expressed protein [Batrachochytrium dendrobatidis JAM81]|eukprot:XP_006678072.1 expressed protein [Batrachochytrium dendrobatidis JAM81]